MNCKNCQDSLEKDAQFCDNCGAKVIKSRITFKFLITDLFINVFGVDSKFFLTLRKMLTHPQDVINEYLTGVRKRYVNPFAFLAVGAALSLIFFNFFSDDFIKINNAFNEVQNSEMIALAKSDSTAYIGLNQKEIASFKIQKQIAETQLKFQKNWIEFMLGYYNLLAFLFLPLYALISKLTYFKPYNFGEHLIINTYLQGTTMFIALIAFFISLVTSPLLYSLSLILVILYYLFAFSKLYKHSLGKSILKLLRFIIILIIFFIITAILAVAIGFILKITGFF